MVFLLQAVEALFNFLVLFLYSEQFCFKVYVRELKISASVSYIFYIVSTVSLIEHYILYVSFLDEKQCQTFSSRRAKVRDYQKLDD